MRLKLITVALVMILFTGCAMLDVPTLTDRKPKSTTLRNSKNPSSESDQGPDSTRNQQNRTSESTTTIRDIPHTIGLFVEAVCSVTLKVAAVILPTLAIAESNIPQQLNNPAIISMQQPTAEILPVLHQRTEQAFGIGYHPANQPDYMVIGTSGTHFPPAPNPTLAPTQQSHHILLVALATSIFWILVILVLNQRQPATHIRTHRPPTEN